MNGAGAPPDEPSSEWQVGQWWKWRLTSVAHDPVEVTAIVVNETMEGYAVGVSAPEDAQWALAFHNVPMGPVTKPNLAWMAHGVPVEIVDRPLQDGKSWKRSFWFGEDVTLTATAEPGSATLFRIQSELPDGGQTWTGLWDDTAGVFVELNQFFGGTEPFSTATLVDGGQTFAGTAFSVAYSDLFRRGGAAVPPPDPASSFAVPADAKHLFVACWLGGAPGHYEVALLPPSGTPARCEQTYGPDGGGTRLHVLLPPVEPGQWRVETVVGGQGFVNVEAIRLDLATSGDVGQRWA